MKKKNESLLKTIHTVLIALGFALSLYMLFSSKSSTLLSVMFLLRAAAFVASFVYLTEGYKKNADLFYKMFLWLVGLSTIISYTSFISLGMKLTMFKSFITVMILVSFIFIIAAKDYGKVKSNIISITLAVLNVINIAMILKSTNYDVLNPNVLIAIGQLILALTLAIMVWVKYLDKEARGAKI